MENKLIKIGAAAKLIGVSTETLRYWDEDGILKPIVKSKGGTRYYSIDSINKLLAGETSA